MGINALDDVCDAMSFWDAMFEFTMLLEPVYLQFAKFLNGFPPIGAAKYGTE